MISFRHLGAGVALALVVSSPAASSAATFVRSSFVLTVSGAASDTNTPPVVNENQSKSIFANDQTVFDQAMSIDFTQGAGRASASNRLDTVFSPSSLTIDAGVMGSDRSGNGSSSGFGGASILYELVFAIDLDTPYAFDIDIRTNDTGGGTANLRLLDESGTEVFAHNPISGDFVILQEVGVLAPGEYTLELEMIANPSSERSAVANVLVRGVIPEPGTGSLVAFGLIGIASRRRLLGHQPS